MFGRRVKQLKDTHKMTPRLCNQDSVAETDLWILKGQRRASTSERSNKTWINFHQLGLLVLNKCSKVLQP